MSSSLTISPEPNFHGTSITSMVTIGGDNDRNFGAKKCSLLLMMVITFVLVAWAKALRRVVVSFDVKGLCLVV